MKHLSDEMNLVPIGTPILKKVPEPFNFEEEDAKKWATKLTNKMIELGGVGLAANQVGLDMAIMSIGVRNPTSGEEFSRVCFNPQLISVSDKHEVMREGCLSVPGLRLNIKRPIECTLKYFDENQEEKTEKYTGLAARVALHEYDHMLGYNFMHRVSRLKLDRAMKSLDKRVKAFNRRTKD